MSHSVDVAIVGGGPAGLSAALSAARMARQAIVFQAGTPRAAHAPCYHNYLGFADGISGSELLTRGRAHVERWGVRIVEAAVTEITATADAGGRFRLETTDGASHARGIVLAVGVKDRQLPCGDLYRETGSGVHYCVVCDGRETQDERAAVVGSGEEAYGMVCALRDFTTDVWLLLDGEEPGLGRKERARLEGWGVTVIGDRLAAYEAGSDGIVFRTGDGRSLSFPHVFIARGVVPRTELAVALGCRTDREGYVVTDERQETSVPWVYAAGDCDGGAKQVTQAMAEGELAALELVRRLREEEEERG